MAPPQEHFSTKWEIIKAIGVGLGALASSAYACWKIGDWTLGIFFLSIIPVILIGWGLSWMTTPKRVRELFKKLTAEERKELNKIVFSRGLEAGEQEGKKVVFLLIPACVLAGFLFAFCGQSMLWFLLPSVRSDIPDPIAIRPAKGLASAKENDAISQ